MHTFDSIRPKISSILSIYLRGLSFVLVVYIALSPSPISLMQTVIQLHYRALCGSHNTHFFKEASSRYKWSHQPREKKSYT